MEAALDGVPPAPFPRPADVVDARGLQAFRAASHAGLPETRSSGSVHARPICRIARTTCTGASMSARRTASCAFDLVPANARETRGVRRVPAADTDWGPKNGFPAPPTQRCDDVYQGRTGGRDRRARPRDDRSAAPSRSSAQRDDGRLQPSGPGGRRRRRTRPSGRRSPMAAQQGVDRALLGVWNTAGYPPGRYTLRLTRVRWLRQRRSSGQARPR